MIPARTKLHGRRNYKDLLWTACRYSLAHREIPPEKQSAAVRLLQVFHSRFRSFYRLTRMQFSRRSQTIQVHMRLSCLRNQNDVDVLTLASPRLLARCLIKIKFGNFVHYSNSYITSIEHTTSWFIYLLLLSLLFLFLYRNLYFSYTLFTKINAYWETKNLYINFVKEQI